MVYGRILITAVIGLIPLLGIVSKADSLPSYGDLRLAGSGVNSQGRVEIFRNGSWGTVCDDYWDINEGNVVCRQLGFIRAVAVYSSAYFGRGNGTIWRKYLHCNGNETRLVNCPHYRETSYYCSHTEDAGVACQNGTGIGQNGNGSCTFERGPKLCGYKNLRGDNFDWTLSNAGYHYWYYLPRRDHTTGNGRYLYIRSQYFRRVRDKAQIISPLITGGKCVHFYYFMKGSSVGELNVYIDNGSNRTLLWQNVGPQSSVWIKAIVPITGLTTPFQIVFEGVIGGRYAADIALDDIQVFQKPCVYNYTGACTFEPGVFCGYTNAYDNAIKWVLHKGRIGYSSIGPTADHTTGSGYYIYLKTTWRTIRGQISRLVSPEIYGAQCVQFYYYIGGSSPGELSVYVDDGVKPTLVWQLIGQQANKWSKGMVLVKGHLKAYKVIFEGTSGTYYRGRIALDDITIIKASCKVYPSAANVEPMDIRNISNEVRLVGNTSSSAGRLEVLYKGRWGTVCGSNFPLTSGRVACRQLGFSDVLLVVPCCSLFGTGKGRILLQNVRCRGDEPDIKMCAHRGWGITSCSHRQDIGVICVTNTTEKFARLNGSSHDYEGRAEVQIAGIWGTISDSGWDIYDADVFCRQAGFAGATGVYNNAHYGRGTGPIWITNTNCNGDEKSFWNCNYTLNGNSMVYGSSYWHRKDAGAECFDLKLSGGKTKMEGIVLIRYGGTWGTICNDGWDINDANVVCRHLGSHKAKSIKLDYHVTPPNKTRPLLTRFKCTGSEVSLGLCRRTSLGFISHQCTHNNDAMVVCEYSGKPPTSSAPTSPASTPAQQTCQPSKKHGKVCVCANAKKSKSDSECYVLGVNVVAVSLEANMSQWNPGNFKVMLAKQLNQYCTNHSCGDNRHFDASGVIIFKTSPKMAGHLMLQFLVFDSHSRKPIASKVIDGMIHHDKTLAGFVVISHGGHVDHVVKRKAGPNVTMLVGISLAVLAVGAILIIIVVYKRKRTRSLRSLVRYHVPSPPPELDFSDEEDDPNEDERLLALDDDQAPLLPASTVVV